MQVILFYNKAILLVKDFFIIFYNNTTNKSHSEKLEKIIELLSWSNHSLSNLEENSLSACRFAQAGTHRQRCVPIYFSSQLRDRLTAFFQPLYSFSFMFSSIFGINSLSAFHFEAISALSFQKPIANPER